MREEDDYKGGAAHEGQITLSWIAMLIFSIPGHKRSFLFRGNGVQPAFAPATFPARSLATCPHVRPQAFSGKSMHATAATGMKPWRAETGTH